jgi:hypothetical protein
LASNVRFVPLAAPLLKAEKPSIRCTIISAVHNCLADDN